ncbi:MAG: RNA polymerase factor sigma-54 [Planctomycetes bacterium]|nr:RNA polymerase factor sigma-54 [Planctomycetota bacterium]
MRMELGLSQHQTIKQIQTLSPQMYMSMEILCLNSLDLEERIETELENNETLELAEATKPEEAPAQEAPQTTQAKEDSFERRFEGWEEYGREEYASARRLSSYDGEKDEKLEALNNTEGRPTSLQEHLEEQVHLLEREEILRLVGPPESLSNEAKAFCSDPLKAILDLCVDVIYNIDSRGYLMYSLEAIQESLDPKPPLDLLQKALAVVQSLDPPGIGGRDLRECLLLQLRRDKQEYPVEEKIIEGHLEELGHNRLPKIAKALGITVDEVKAAAETIACLNPLPGNLYGGEAARSVKPDVLVDEVEGKYEVRVDSDYLPRIQVSSHYRDLYKTAKSDPDLKKYLKKKIDSAEWLLAAIRQRQLTLRRIAQELVDIQSGFLDHGISHLKPLKMVEVAERVGVHVSTISRAISGKYMQTPRGIFPMKFFFSGGASKSDGTVEARGSIIQRIKDFIAGEDKSNPLSDIDIVKKLSESSIKISRRTVTKYREAESIPSSRERRSY